MNSWIRVSRDQPCPVCGRADWCLISWDKSAAICARLASERRAGRAGWLHRLKESADWKPRPRRLILRVRPQAASSYFQDLSEHFQAQGKEAGQLAVVAESLGVTTDSLIRFGVGWCLQHKVSTWPMRDSTGRIVGINRRYGDGSKRIMRGHKAGLYMPEDLPADFGGRTLVITEGGSDAVVGLDLGFWTAGRFSCSHGAVPLADLVSVRRPGCVVIVADVDPDGAGERGAGALCSALLPYVECVKVITPPAPYKDLRAWRTAGAKREDLVDLIELAKPRTLVVRIGNTWA